MSNADLNRGAVQARTMAPVRHVHLGLGNFFRAHQAWYTDRCPDAGDWGIAAFTGRSTEVPQRLNEQECLYTLLTRGAKDDDFRVVASLSAAHPGTDQESLLGYLASPDVRVVTLTVTEAGYRRNASGGLDREDPHVQTDIATLRAGGDEPLRTLPGRLVGGLAARRRADAGPIAIVSCDNLAGNGAAANAVLRDVASDVDPDLLDWIDEEVAVVTTMVDRITPRTTPEIREAVEAATGRHDAAPVATEPFSEWVVSGKFPGGRPAWHDAGATFTDDIEPYEHRKLWLLNGGHSLLAYLGSIRGHATVDDAIADEVCRTSLETWWAEAAAHLSQPPADISAYQARLLDRFGNARLPYQLDQIAADGSQKLPVRILPVLRAERSAGRMPSGAVCAVAAWITHLRGHGAAINDPAADTLTSKADGGLSDAVPRVLAALDPHLPDDEALTTQVTAEARRLDPR